MPVLPDTFWGQYMQPQQFSTAVINPKTGQADYALSFNNGFSAPAIPFDGAPNCTDYQRRLLNLAYLTNLYFRRALGYNGTGLSGPITNIKSPTQVVVSSIG